MASNVLALQQEKKPFWNSSNVNLIYTLSFANLNGQLSVISKFGFCTKTHVPNFELLSSKNNLFFSFWIKQWNQLTDNSGIDNSQSFDLPKLFVLYYYKKIIYE